MKTIKIFLASSEELADDRKEFGNLIRRLDDIYQKRGIHIQLFVWEDLDLTLKDRRKQDEYNDVIRQCHVFVALFYKQAGKFTREELEVAQAERQIRRIPHIIIYCKDLKEGDVETKELIDFKKHLSTELGHFWGHYGTGDKLHLDFVMWLQRTELDDKDALKLEEGQITFEGIPIATLSQLPFAAGNPNYQQMKEKIGTLSVEIKKINQAIEQCPGVDTLKELLQQKLDEYNRLKKDFEQHQQALFDTAKRISEMQLEKTSLNLRRAITAFEEGNVERANILLDEIASEAEWHIMQLDQQKHLVHQDIKAFLLQAKTVMAEVSVPINERISKTLAIYVKSDEWAKKSMLPMEDYNDLLSDYGIFLLEYAFYEEAKAVYYRLIANEEKKYGLNHPMTATSYNNIGVVFFHKGEYTKALEYYNKALKIRQQVLGDEHSDTANTYNKIGLVYDSLEDNEKTLEYYFKALEIREKVLGTEHPDSSGSYKNIGNVCYRQKKYNDALEYYFKALTICEKVFGLEHADTADCYSNIGMVYSDLGDFKEAIDYYSKALAIRKKKLGARHPDTAKSYNNIGLALANQGDYSKALWAYFKAAAIFDTVLGIEHPNTAITYNNIALSFVGLKNFEKAKEYYEKALVILKDKFGTKHHLTQTVIDNINRIEKEEVE
jgi:tetratricopeptide (TPR) repeat protein